MAANPLARSQGLLVEELDDELVICDTERDVLHRLNGPAAACWKALDGTKDITTLASELYPEVGQQSALSLLTYTLKRLDDKHLMVTAPPPTQISRRYVLRQIPTGIAASAVLATVVTLVTPPPSAHASGGTLPINSPCTQSCQCMSNCCCPVSFGSPECLNTCGVPCASP